VSKKFVLMAAGALALAALALGALLFLSQALFPSPSAPAGLGPADAKTASTGPGEQLKPAEAAEVQAALEKVAGAEGARAALSGGVDQPWPKEQALQEFQSCRTRLEGNPDLVDATAPDAVERTCLCVAKKMQKAFPGDAPGRKKARDARAYSRVELSAIEECVGK
jgi:hypothetical protein